MGLGHHGRVAARQPPVAGVGLRFGVESKAEHRKDSSAGQSPVALSMGRVGRPDPGGQDVPISK